MRILLIVSLIVWSLTAIGSAFAADCAVMPAEPKRPLGCRQMQPTCVCDAKGNCRWEFVCVRQ